MQQPHDALFALSTLRETIVRWKIANAAASKRNATEAEKQAFTAASAEFTRARSNAWEIVTDRGTLEEKAALVSLMKPRLLKSRRT